MLSKQAGRWTFLRVRTDQDPELARRVLSMERGTGDPRRAIRAIASRMTSSNTVIALRDDETV